MNMLPEAEFRELLTAKINAVNMKMLKADIIRFISDPKAIDHWSPQYFHDLVKQMIID